MKGPIRCGEQFDESVQRPLCVPVTLGVGGIGMHFTENGIDADCQRGTQERQQKLTFAARCSSSRAGCLHRV